MSRQRVSRPSRVNPYFTDRFQGVGAIAAAAPSPRSAPAPMVRYGLGRVASRDPGENGGGTSAGGGTVTPKTPPRYTTTVTAIKAMSPVVASSLEVAPPIAPIRTGATITTPVKTNVLQPVVKSVFEPSTPGIIVDPVPPPIVVTTTPPPAPAPSSSGTITVKPMPMPTAPPRTGSSGPMFDPLPPLPEFDEVEITATPTAPAARPIPWKLIGIGAAALTAVVLLTRRKRS